MSLATGRAGILPTQSTSPHYGMVGVLTQSLLVALIYRSFTLIMAITNLIRSNNLWGDILGGVTAAIVPLPLALTFGVASGVDPLGGLRQFVAAFLPPYLAVPQR